MLLFLFSDVSAFPISAFPLTAFDQAYETLAEDPSRSELVPENEPSQFADSVEKEIKAGAKLILLLFGLDSQACGETAF